MIRVGVNGYGTIGKRVADAIVKQNDIKLVGVTAIKYDFTLKTAIKKGYKVYCALPDCKESLEEVGVELQGMLDDLLNEVDVIVDATPEGIGAKNKKIYEKAGVKAIFEGGEKANVAQVSFVAQCNYDEAFGKDYIRVVSCNTTGLCRTLNTIKQNFGIKKVRAIMIRRAADPHQINKGPINAIIPHLHIPSHHGPDVQTVIKDLNIITAAVNVPTTVSHLHIVMVELENDAKEDDVIDAFENTTRVLLVSKDEGIESTAQVIEYARDMLRPRNDMYEICVWKESINIKGNELYYIQAVHQEADVIPENIDAIRAAMEACDARESIKRTNKALGIVK